MQENWIDINQRSPELGERIIAATQNGFVGECYIDENGDLRRYDGEKVFRSIFGSIIAWMPMPPHPNAFINV